MTWFKVDDKLHDHRKTRRARRGGDRPRDASAIGLWVLAGSWSADNLTDGFVPEDELDSWDSDGHELAKRLVSAGFWTEAEQDGEAGYRFTNWPEHQPTKAQVEAKREDARERMRRARGKGGDVRANSAGTARAVTPTPTRPDPTKNKNTADAAASADFDRFWTLYPRKVGKVAAAKAFTKALRTTDVAAIAAGLHNACQVWTAAGTDPKFIPHPSTWLNEGRWADEQPLLPGTPTDRQDPAAAIQATYDLPPLPAPPPDLSGREATQWLKDRRAEQRAELERQAGDR